MVYLTNTMKADFTGWKELLTVLLPVYKVIQCLLNDDAFCFSPY